MKKCFIVFGAISVIFLMASAVTAVPQVHSETVMKTVSDIEQQRVLLEEKFKICTEKLAGISSSLQPRDGPIIDFLIRIIGAIIDTLNSMVELLDKLDGLKEIILSFIDALTEFKEWLEGFTPGSLASIQ